ncbi:uncharacterized protein LOC120936245 [Rana temporaria]|uniref:uncharacterized protein LOC120936245 n=1 Tax=Rana temporaria TaxID=8407 RepID=UPI001AADD5AC|nr:uncharacterized protein LOC120936245 [Rana temporaria]
MIFRLFIFLLFLHLVTSVEITSIQTYHHELNVTVGQQLLIPCHFQLDEPLGGNKIKLAWSVKPPDEDEFRPIYQTEDTTRLTVKFNNNRAMMHLSDVHQGDCSLVIDPVHRDDAGTYDLRIAINGEEFPEDTRVDVHIRESRVQIKSIQIYHHELNVTVGQQLLIPCHFQLDEPLEGDRIKLEWSVKSPGKDEFQPIYQFEDTTQLTVKSINSRARMHWTDVRQGDCSLAIDPVHRDDGGTYDLRIAINGEVFPGDTRVDVHIRGSRVKIKSVQTYQHELNTTVGQQLIIPCHFNVDKPLSNNLVLLKWSMRPIGEDRFQPIIKVYDTKLLPLEHPTRTVSVDVPRVRQGICSLRINPVHLNDSGTYVVHLAINGDEFPGHTRVNIYVKQSDKETDPNQPMNDEESQSRKASENEDLDFMRTAEVLQGLKDNYSLILEICGGVLLLIVLLSMVLIFYFGCRYCQLKHKAVDDVKQREEGRQCGLPVPTTYVSIPENWHKESNSAESWHEGSNSARRI